MINVGNEKVSPEEVERVLLEVRGVAEAGVYGIPDAVTGESVRAKIVVDRVASIDMDGILRHCRAMLSGFKVPRQISVVETLPRSLYGKMDRTKLKEA